MKFAKTRPFVRLILAGVVLLSLILILNTITVANPMRFDAIDYTYNRGHDTIKSTNNKTGLQESTIQHLPLTILTLIPSGQIQSLRELVGSIHKLRETNVDIPNIVVYGFGLEKKEQHEIRLWRNVEYLDGYEALFLGQKSKSPDSENFNYPSPEEVCKSQSVILNSIELNLRRFQHVLYVKLGHRFVADSIHGVLDDLLADGIIVATSAESLKSNLDKKAIKYTDFSALGFSFSTSMYHMFVSFQIQCLRGYHCDEYFKQNLLEFQRENLKRYSVEMKKIGLESFDPSSGYKYLCNLLLRDDILYSFEYGGLSHTNGVRNLNDESGTIEKKSDKIVIAIGMPTLSVSGLSSFTEVSPIRTFLPSFLTSITDDEWKRFRYVIYMGYDEGDLFFGNVEGRSNINKELMRLLDDYRKERSAALKLPESESLTNYFEVDFEFVEFPYSKGWVTYLWNGLFVHAIKDGADYFYQVNDDLILRSSGWSTKFIDAYMTLDDLGIVGPTDINHNSNLLTQAFVSRKHYEIFGKIYPIDIKDWYSDNWIGDVYGERRKVLSDVTIHNLNDKGTRYNVCMQPNYGQILEKGKAVIESWLDDLKASKKSEKSSRDIARLNQEILEGPILS